MFVQSEPLCTASFGLTRGPSVAESIAARGRDMSWIYYPLSWRSPTPTLTEYMSLDVFRDRQPEQVVPKFAVQNPDYPLIWAGSGSYEGEMLKHSPHVAQARVVVHVRPSVTPENNF